MGDSGSLFLGLNLAVLTLASPSEAHASTSLLSIMAGPAMILLVPILDTTLVTVSRFLSGRSAAHGGLDHSSHRLVAIGLSQRAAVLALWSLSALGGLLGVALQHYDNDLPSLVAALFVIGMIIFTVYLAHVRVYDDHDSALNGQAASRPSCEFRLQASYRGGISRPLPDRDLRTTAPTACDSAGRGTGPTSRGS